MELHKLDEETLGKRAMEEIFAKDIFDKYAPTESLFSSHDLHLFLGAEETKKVLIVEDDLWQINVLEELVLEINSEAQIDWEIDIPRAINRLTSEKNESKGYDVIICDIELGTEASGVDLFQYCLEHEPFTELILISAHSREKLNRKYFKKMVPLNYMKKPLNFESFFRRVSPILTQT